jgi:hypothetical protein
MRWFIIFLVLSTAAQAQYLSRPGACVSQDLSAAWTSNEDSCRSAGGNFHPLPDGSWSPPVTGTVTGMNPPVVGQVTTQITNTTMPTCDEGWTLVSDLSMHPMCARELKKPN